MLVRALGLYWSTEDVPETARPLPSGMAKQQVHLGWGYDGGCI